MDGQKEAFYGRSEARKRKLSESEALLEKGNESDEAELNDFIDYLFGRLEELLISVIKRSKRGEIYTSSEEEADDYCEADEEASEEI